jgi:lipopolysaccharide export LptBFGC system permease protein LptF
LHGLWGHLWVDVAFAAVCALLAFVALAVGTREARKGN